MGMAVVPKKAPKKVLKGKIALVAGATRGAGRGIAIALGEAGATVYCTGRSSRKQPRERTRGRPATPGRPETIEETAELVTAAGGRGIAVRVDHTEPAEVKKLVVAIKRRHKGLDILVNDVWGGDALTEFGKTFWTVNLDNGLRMLKQAIHSHIITSHYAVPPMLGRGRGIIFEITDGDAFYYRGNLFYDLVKISVIRLAFAMARELRKRDIVSVALTPGFLRSEAVLDHFGVSEANWKEAGKKDPPGPGQKGRARCPRGFHGVRIAKVRRTGGGSARGRSEGEKEERTCLQFLGAGPGVRIHRPRRHPAGLGPLCQKEVRKVQNLR
jgi:NAD(P)-dependent dehydrogenase (short-subunit alcohol dehydrogenase family)